MTSNGGHVDVHVSHVSLKVVVQSREIPLLPRNDNS